METLMAIPPAKSNDALLLYCTIGLAIGALVWLSMRNPRFRRPEFRESGAFSQPASIITGLLVAGVVCLLFYVTMGGPRVGFSRVDADGNGFLLHYEDESKAKVTLPYMQVQRIELYNSGTRYYRLRVVTKGGKQHTSVALYRRMGHKYHRKLKGRLHKGRKGR